MDATSIQGIPVALPPSFAANPPPNGDTADGMGLCYRPSTGKIEFMQPHIDCGPASLAVNVSFNGRTMKPLYLGPADENGMLQGLVQYPPDGIWNLRGKLVLACPTNTEISIYVKKGTTISDPSRPKIVGGNEVIIGAGSDTWTGPADKPFSISFDAYKFAIDCGPLVACEVSVWVYAKCDGPAGAVLGSTTSDAYGGGDIPPDFLSNCSVERASALP